MTIRTRRIINLTKLFFQTKIIYFIIAVFFLLCVVATVIFIRVSSGMVNMKVYSDTFNDNIGVNSVDNSSSVSVENFVKHDLYINCELSNNSNAYTDTKENVLIPLDSILELKGEKFTYYSSDDIITTKVNSKELKFRLGEKEVLFDGKEIIFPIPSLSSNNHIYISTEFIKYVGNIGVLIYPESKKVFMNYFPDNINNYVNSLHKKNIEKSSKGKVFYTRGLMVYSENYGNEKKLFRLPFKCEYVFGTGNNYPYIIVSKTGDSVNYITQKTITEIGKYSYLLNKAQEKSVDFLKSILASPDKKCFVVFQKDTEKGQVNLNIMKKSWNKPKNLTLNIFDLSKVDEIKRKWISNNCLLVYTKNAEWIIEISDKVYVYGKDEKKKSILSEIA